MWFFPFNCLRFYFSSTYEFGLRSRCYQGNGEGFIEKRRGGEKLGLRAFSLFSINGNGIDKDSDNASNDDCNNCIQFGTTQTQPNQSCTERFFSNLCGIAVATLCACFVLLLPFPWCWCCCCFRYYTPSMNTVCRGVKLELSQLSARG